MAENMASRSVERSNKFYKATLNNKSTTSYVRYEVYSTET